MKKPLSITLVSLLLLLAASPLAAEQETFTAFPNALGIFGSSLTGNFGGGLHYQRWGEKWGFQVTAGGFYDPEATFGSTLAYSVSLEGTRALYTNYFKNWFAGRLYLWGSVGHQGYNDLADDYYDYDLGAYVHEDGKFGLDALAGLGIGIEVVIFQHFSFPIQFGYMGSFPSTPRVSFTTSGGLSYRY